MKQGLWWLVLCWFCFSAVELLAVEAIHLGPRPFFLVGDMDNGPLKDKLIACQEKLVSKRDFSSGIVELLCSFPSTHENPIWQQHGWVLVL